MKKTAVFSALFAFSYVALSSSGCQREVSAPVSTTPVASTSTELAPPSSAPSATPITERPSTEPVTRDQIVFIARTVSAERLDCAQFDTPEAPHRRPPRPLSDATDDPERFSISFDVVEVAQGPAIDRRLPSARAERGEQKERAIVAFALGVRAFPDQQQGAPHSAYDRGYCARLNAWLAAEYTVLVAYPIHVDRGNAMDPGPWFSLGTDPGKANAAFDTLEEAQKYVAVLLRVEADAPSD